MYCRAYEQNRSCAAHPIQLVRLVQTPDQLEEQTTMLDFNLDIHTRWQIKPHQHIYRLRIRVQNINKTIMRTDLKVLVRVFINESRAAYCKPFFLRWQGYRSNNMGTGALCGFDNPLGRLVENAMVVSLKADADLLLRHIVYLPIG